MTAAERAGKLTPQLMAAIAATLDTTAAQTMVVAGGNTLMVGGTAAGIGCPASWHVWGQWGGDAVNRLQQRSEKQIPDCLGLP